MSERKVLNKYYPPDFDPSKVPRGKRNKNATFNIRIMAPFNMRCNMCKEYIYKGKKFNSRKEDVMDEDYLGLKIFRFYIKCPRCVSEIAFKTDLKNTDYTLEAGATRLFEAEKIAKQMAEQEQKEKEEDELNPMKVLENRTKQSQLEMEQIDSLEELREMNTRKNAVNTDDMIEKYRKYEELLLQLQMEEEEKQIKEIFGSEGSAVVKRLHDSDSDGDEPKPKSQASFNSVKEIFGSEGSAVVKRLHDSDSDGDEPKQKTFKPASTASTVPSKATDILTSTEEQKPPKAKAPAVWEKSVGGMSSKAKLAGLVVKKKSTKLPPFSVSEASSESANTTVTGSNGLSQTSQISVNGSLEKVDAGQTSERSTSKPSTETSQDKNDLAKDTDSSKLAQSSETIEISSQAVVQNTNSQAAVQNTTSQVTVQNPSGLGGLGMLGAYSDSESETSDG